LNVCALVLAVAACSADPDANERHGERCDDDTQMAYKGFCVPKRQDGGSNTAGTGGDADGGAGILEGACEPEGAERECYPGGAVGVGEGPCKVGTQRCIDSKWGECDGDVAPIAESCNDIDDDCNGAKDDVPEASCMTAQDGVCEAGVYACETGLMVCQAREEPRAETCNGDDDDCDGQSDEGTSLPCYPDVDGCVENADDSFTCIGQCAPGVQDCALGEQGTCGGMIVPVEGNDDCTTGGGLAFDDDCDGEIDENCACSTAGETQDCYGGADGTHLVPPCTTGTQTCDGERFGPCMNQRVPEQETCENEGVDDDCDGRTDEIPNRYMVCSDEEMEGICRFGRFNCDGDAFGCVTPDSSAEQCNGLDDDCNGVVDDDFQLLHDEHNCGQCGEQCSGELNCCGGQCVDMTADEDHCGACGEPCSEGSTCCGGVCVDTRVNTDHCGACGEGCGADRNCCGGTCVDTRVHTDHCGACDDECATGEACCTGECADQDSPLCASCAEDCEVIDQQCCFGSCVDQEGDEFNCGACGNACDPGEICCGGDCVPSDRDHCGQACAVCGLDALCCGGSCVESDAANCNVCGNVCTAGTTCCDMAGCKNLQNDPNNCGACGMPVGEGDICTTGHSCPMNNAWCGGGCVSILNNEQHCGQCNNPCDGLLETCQGTMCRFL
jgi:hypothetical protein